MARDRFNINTLTTEFDYNLLKSSLRDYGHPRVKKGIYVKSRQPYSPLVLANMIYGPSYVSQDFALSLYDLIPERVTTVTSMTTGRNKEFNTPCGDFSYEHLSPHFYIYGLRRIEIEGGRAYLIASPEKALIDRIWTVKGLNTLKNLEDYLEGDMRLDFTNIQQIKISNLRKLAKIYDKPALYLLEKLLRDRMPS